jgi:hypothetical protein
MELAGSDVNHENAGLDRDEENNHILSASTFPASPHWMINRVMCSIVDVSSCPENLVKSGTLYLGGKVSDRNQRDMVSCTCRTGAWFLFHIASVASLKSDQLTPASY